MQVSEGMHSQLTCTRSCIQYVIIPFVSYSCIQYNAVHYRFIWPNTTKPPQHSQRSLYKCVLLVQILTSNEFAGIRRRANADPFSRTHALTIIHAGPPPTTRHVAFFGWIRSWCLLSFVVCRSSSVVRRSSFVVRRSSFVVRRSSFGVQRSAFVVLHSSSVHLVSEVPTSEHKSSVDGNINTFAGLRDTRRICVTLECVALSRSLCHSCFRNSRTNNICVCVFFNLFDVFSSQFRKRTSESSNPQCLPFDAQRKVWPKWVYELVFAARWRQ